MDSTTRRHILLLSLVLAALILPLLQGCEMFDAPNLAAGESTCTASTKAECAKLEAIAAGLHTPEMERRIAEARR